ncbi:MAG: 50S ribosomal protein L24 [Candidatus Pacearchaeota archaeon]|jgi:large subunit ribosomal protein L24
MKKDFSIHWRKSRQTRKQRKFIANAPRHIKKKTMSSHLSKELRKKYGKRSFPIRKGDMVKIMIGSSKGKSGKVILVIPKREQVAIEGIQRKKKDGTKINVYFNASNLMIQELELGDKKRVEALTRKAPAKVEIKNEDKKDNKTKKVKEKK